MAAFGKSWLQPYGVRLGSWAVYGPRGGGTLETVVDRLAKALCRNRHHGYGLGSAGIECTQGGEKVRGSFCEIT